MVVQNLQVSENAQGTLHRVWVCWKPYITTDKLRFDKTTTDVDDVLSAVQTPSDRLNTSQTMLNDTRFGNSHCDFAMVRRSLGEQRVQDTKRHAIQVPRRVRNAFALIRFFPDLHQVQETEGVAIVM